MENKSLFDIALETGDTYLNMSTMEFYRFDEYAKFKHMGLPTSGVYLTDENGFICGLWENEYVEKYIHDHGLKPKWLKKDAS